MANEEHVAILKQGVKAWNIWRQENPQITPDLSHAIIAEVDLARVNLREADLVGADFTKTNLQDADFTEAKLAEANLIEIDLTGANLREANLAKARLIGSKLVRANLAWAYLIGVNLTRSDLTEANLSGANLGGADLGGADLKNANLKRADFCESDLSGADLSNADLSKANLKRAYLNRTNLSRANLSDADLSLTQAIQTNFTEARFTGAYLEDWNINSSTNLNDVICEYVYLRQNQQSRCPVDKNFIQGEFTKLFQKTSSIIELIFNNGVDWLAFSYSLGKLRIENEIAEIAVQGIESKGDGIVVVKVSISQDTNKERLYKEFMQGYEFAHKVLEEKYRAELGSKNAQIMQYNQENQSQKEYINNLFSLLQQLTAVQKIMVESPNKVSNYYLPNSQFAGGIVDANTVHVQQIGGDIYNIDNQEHPD